MAFRAGNGIWPGHLPKRADRFPIVRFVPEQEALCAFHAAAGDVRSGKGKSETETGGAQKTQPAERRTVFFVRQDNGNPSMPEQKLLIANEELCDNLRLHDSVLKVRAVPQNDISGDAIWSTTRKKLYPALSRF